MSSTDWANNGRPIILSILLFWQGIGVAAPDLPPLLLHATDLQSDDATQHWAVRQPPPKHCGIIARIASDMTLADDGIPAPRAFSKQQQPATKAYNVYGVIASGESTLGARGQTNDMRTYRAVAPWITVSAELGNPSTDAEIEIGQPSVRYFSRRAKSYQVLADPAPLSGALCTPDVSVTQCQELAVSSPAADVHAVRIPNTHRYAGRYSAVTIDPHDIEFMFVTIPMRITGSGAKDARFLARVGAEYYQNVGHIPYDPKAPRTYAGVSRLRRLSVQWQTLHYATIVTNGVQTPGSGQAVSFLIGNPPACALDAKRGL